MVLTKRTSKLPLICQICGDTARGINFDAMTCMSCKAFFRRHALQPTDSLKCPLDNNCIITLSTRSGCSACRLKKCFSFGMNPTLIRHTSQDHRQLVKKKTSSLPKLHPLNLLRNDASTLTSTEWNLLSNILHAYDQGNSIEQTKSMLQHQSSLPLKLRLKSTITLDIVEFFYSTCQSFIERTAYFHDLPIDVRQILIQQNSKVSGTYNSIFLVRETNALDYPAYVDCCLNIYGLENYHVFKKFLQQLESNVVLCKIMLLIIGFSGNCSIVAPDNAENLIPITSAMSLIHIQNILITMLWKYLNYQYGFLGAVKCFNSLIKFILNIFRWIETGYNVQQEDIVDQSFAAHC